jgi:single-strand DNA-binding protein
MNGKNFVQLVGFVGQDLRTDQTKNGQRVAIRVATHYYFRNESGAGIDQTTWHNIVAWDKTADYAGRNFVKGSKIMVEGRIIQGTFTGKDGQPRSAMYVKTHNLLNLDR